MHGVWELHRDVPGASTRASTEATGGDPRRVHDLSRVHRGLSRGRHPGGRVKVIHPIEGESYRILEGRVDLSHLAPLSRAVIARMIHASADLDFAKTTVLDER